MNPHVDPLRVLVKAFILFVIVNIFYAVINPQSGKVSGYNVIFPGRTRLPFGITGDPYTVTVDYVDGMFASHLIAAPKDSGEYRVALIGDSSIWGENLGAYEMISQQWNQLGFRCGDRSIRAYNLGYPHPSIVKDLVILEKVTEYKPDLIIWFVTLNTLFSQRVNPFLVANRERAATVLDSYDIAFQGSRGLASETPGFFERTLVGRRSALARQIKLEMLGLIWTATRSDTNTLAPDDPPDFTVSEDAGYRRLQPSDPLAEFLLLDALNAGIDIAGAVPVLIVNEPIFVVDETVSRVRYNPVYPRWAYDQYRTALAAEAQRAGWNYLDLWNGVPPAYFSDAGLHLSLQGERQLVQQINPELQSLACGTNP